MLFSEEVEMQKNATMKTFKEALDETCKAYVDRGKPTKTDYDKTGYDLCCKQHYYCEVWMQPWFWYTLGGVILLLILISVAGGVWCCCLRKRNQGGGNNEVDKKEGSESSRDSV